MMGSWQEAGRRREKEMGPPGDNHELVPASPAVAFPHRPAYHEHKHTQELRQALSGQEAADLEPALDFCQAPDVTHGEDTLSLVTAPSAGIGALLVRRHCLLGKR